MTSALAYLGAWSNRECDIITLRKHYNEEIVKKENTMLYEREKDKKHFKDIVGLLNKQSEDLRNTLELLQETLKLVQNNKNEIIGKSSAPVIDTLLETESYSSKPSWLKKNISQNSINNKSEVKINQHLKDILI